MSGGRVSGGRAGGGRVSGGRAGLGSPIGLAPPRLDDTRRELLVNPKARTRVPGAARTRVPLAVHAKLPGYAPTPLASYPVLAAGLGVAGLLVKDETQRLGLPAFKMLGASYAVYRALTQRYCLSERWHDLAEFRRLLAPHAPLTLSAATDGNHGRAVARMARLLGLGAVIYVPAGMSAERIAAIRSEGAAVTVVDGDYDEAVRRSARGAGPRCLVISDTSWPGYTAVPGWVVEGYSTIFAEVADQLAVAGARWPDVVVVPVGVGALACAAVNWLKPGLPGSAGRPGSAGQPDLAAAGPRAPRLLGVEPSTADCVLRSLRARRLVTVPGPHRSIMVGLNCGTPSLVAWPLLAAGLDAVVAIGDGWSRLAMRRLADAGLVAGETGAAALGGLIAVLADPGSAPAREALGLTPRASVLVLVTEGATDRESWERIVGHPVPAADGAGQAPDAGSAWQAGQA